MGLIISVSGIRGRIGTDLGVSEALKLGMIFGRFCAKGEAPIITASDTRVSSAALRSALIAGLLAVGKNVTDLGVATTPTTCLMVRKLSAGGAAIVTASHNPIEWNGIKLIGPDAFGLSAQNARKIQDAFQKPLPEHAGPVECGKLNRDERCHQAHIQAVIDSCDRKLLDDLRFRRTTVVLDSVNGAGTIAGGRLLETLGCNVIKINDQPDGRFRRNPEPIPENLGQLCQAVVENRAQIGFAQDPDADRLAIVDERGKCVGEEYTLALACWFVLSVTPGPVAANLSTSRMIDDIAEGFGQRVIRTAVGEANVAQAILDNNCPVGGEGNGGVILPSVVPVRDSFSAMALILQLIAKTGKTVSELVKELPHYHMVKTKLECSRDQAAELCRTLTEKFADQQINTADGVRIDLPREQAWVHVRPSNTEPIIRIIAEAGDPEKADSLIDMMLSATGQ